ncbi:MAG: aldehyde dehydrogenase family protein [Deltaproteobacteria bacterium]|nr:aldehyde dehydrogenase family protein [Deltaproteobacteria bacterium]
MERSLTFLHKGDYLRGSFYQESGDGFVVDVDPSTGVTLDSIPYRKNAVNEAVSAARDAGPRWASASVDERASFLLRVRTMLESRRDLLAHMAARELGKPVWECMLECAAAERSVDLLIEQGREILRSEPHPTSVGSIERGPLGVTAVLTPAPYPVYGAIQQVLPCLLGGNTVVWKPSSLVPLTSQLVAMCIDSARIPPGVLALVQGPRDPIGQMLVNHPDVALVVGAGSPRMGRALRAQLSDKKPVALQCGGKGWAIVCADADLDRAAYEVVSGAYLTAGQRCNATSRVLVEKEVARDLLTRVVALMRGLTIGNPQERDVFCGPLASEELKQRFTLHLREWGKAGLEFAVEGGAEQLEPALRREGQSYVAPALVVLEDGPLPAGVISPEEVEGPLLLAQLVDSAEEAVERYNAHPFGLSAAIFTESERRFAGLAGILQAGSVNWNRGTIVASARFPNAALGRSGFGCTSNANLLYSCTYPQSRLGTSGRFDPSHRVPGMAWPSEMGVIDPSSAATPPYIPGTP